MEGGSSLVAVAASIHATQCDSSEQLLTTAIILDYFSREPISFPGSTQQRIVVLTGSIYLFRTLDVDEQFFVNYLGVGNQAHGMYVASRNWTAYLSLCTTGTYATIAGMMEAYEDYRQRRDKFANEVQAERQGKQLARSSKRAVAMKRDSRGNELPKPGNCKGAQGEKRGTEIAYRGGAQNVKRGGAKEEGRM